MIKLLKYFRWYYWLLAILIGGLIYLQVSLDLMLPEYTGQIVTLIGTAIKTGTSQTNAILKEGGMMLLICLGSAACTIVTSYIATRIGAGFSKILREKIYSKVDEFSMEEINQFSTSSLITRSTNDITQVQMLIIMVLRMLLTAPIMAIKAIIKIWGISSQMSLTVAIGVIIIVLVITVVITFVMPRFKKIQQLTDHINLVARENLTGLRVVRAYNAEAYQEEKFEEVNKELTKTNLFVHKAMSTMMPLMQFVMNGVSLAIVWLAAFLISKNQLGASPVEGIALQTQFTSYALNIIISFMLLIMMFIMIPRASVSGKRINQVLDTVSKIHNPEYPVAILHNDEASVQGEVEFRNVCFKYPDAEEYVIEQVSFYAKRGQTVAFIGSTGSGKSTLINLVPRFYDASEGEVLINGINVKDYQIDDLHHILGYVPQRSVLFSGTIRSNVTFGKADATDAEIAEALEVAQAKDFVASLEEGIDAPISQGGTNVSGGQKQRLCIARAIIRNPQIYVFDDSFSALDYKTDHNLRKALRARPSQATSLIVAQRIGTIMNADCIIVLDKGKVVGQGTHDELMRHCSVYQDMAYSQLSKEELDNAK